MTDELEYLKQRIPLLDYLQQRNWTARRVGAHLEFVGLCPLHPDTRPSFYVNASKNLFYCHGCGRGGDLIRFIGLSQGLSFRQSVAYLQQDRKSTRLNSSHSQISYAVFCLKKKKNVPPHPTIYS